MSDYRAALIGTALLAAIAGFAFAGAAAPGEPELALLIRFMAVIKAAMALGAVALVAWRLTLPATPRLALAGIAALITAMKRSSRASSGSPGAAAPAKAKPAMAANSAVPINAAR